ncbi:MAG TPA: DUF2235 domain-containing protein, partial [bacterium]
MAATGTMRRLVICADGTWNTPDKRSERTNVVRLTEAALPRDKAGVTQIVKYHKGVGTGDGWDRITGGAFGDGLSENIQDLYLFLIHNYQPGDHVFLFGFSRGAYTARSLAGLIRNSGVLKPEHTTRAKDAYTLYRDRSPGAHPKSEKAVKFRQQYAWPEFNIRCIGVWDTVGALGIPLSAFRFWNKAQYEFHDTDLSSHVDFAFHALAIDERRKPFLPTLWKKQATSPPSQVLEQAWFPGVHSDVGGGYPQTGLSDGAFAWMMNRAGKAGLAVDPTRVKAGNPDGRMHDSMTAMYRLLGPKERTPGSVLPQGFESLHVSTTTRKNYNPRQLLGFKKQTPPPAIS